MRIRTPATLVIGAALLFALAAPAAAQGTVQPGILLGAGISFMHEEGLTATGFSVNVAKDVYGMNSAAVGIVVDFGLHKDTEELLGVDASVTITTFLAGLRVTATSNDKFTPFGQFMLGTGHGSVSVDVAGEQFDESQNALTFAFGGGVNVKLNESVNFLAQLDFLAFRFEGEAANDVRFLFGISTRIGK